ncbi:chord-domain-containing protein [Mycena galopus ATCC 62051]|nr:chord-domain-containing protein [Mycena galopus ATCC 62051]
MPSCTRKGCGREFSESGDASEACTFHPGSAVFHEGLKSWSCCSEVYKPVLEFDEFLKIPGCTQTERHTAEAPRVEAPKPPPSTNLTMTAGESDGQEVYSSGGSASNATPPQNQPIKAVAVPPRPTLVQEEEDDLSISVSVGTPCKHTSCGVAFVSDEVNRIGDGESTVCTYHPQPPIFREGSKGYLCCKRRVLEFDEFMKIEGCKQGRHLFAVKDAKPETEQMTTCRIDHYQTIDRVHVSIFAKKADKERSQVKFEESQISFDLYLPESKRFAKTVELFGPIDPVASSFTFFGTKVELNLKKQDNRSWTILERATQDLGNVSLTFGVGGRTGTIGGKEIILDHANKAKSL